MISDESFIGKEESSLSQVSDFKINRFFSYEGKKTDEFDVNGEKINWISEDVNVSDDRGKVIFTQPNVKRPDFWSPLAIKVVAGRYFWGDQKKNERESSIAQLTGRVSRFIGRQALKQGYFNEKQANVLKDEINALTLNQVCAFNSPVWFNCGIQEYDKNAGGVSAYKWDSKSDSII